MHAKADPIVAFDLLYKFYYVFNVRYPENVINFYNFIDYYIFKIVKSTKSVVTSLHVNISNIKI